MGNPFKKPKIVLPPPLPPPPPVPTIDDAAMRDETERKLARRRGRLATLESKGAPAPSVAAKVLLG